MADASPITLTLLVVGGALLALTLSARSVARLPLSPALIYLSIGWLVGWAAGAPNPMLMVRHAEPMTLLSEFVILLSLFAVGLRLKVPANWRGWRPALMLAGPGMLVTIALASVLAWLLLDLAWPAALLLAAILAPTDPVLASEVQIRADEDRDAVRMSITAEGGLNDGTALPAVMLALGLLGLHDLGTHGASWWWSDMVWPIAGGTLAGAALGYLLGRALRWQMARGDKVARDELLYVGAVALAYGLARSLSMSAFMVAFATGATLLVGLGSHHHEDAHERRLRERLHADGERSERLLEAAVVMAIGVALAGIAFTWAQALFALGLVLIARPLAVFSVIRASAMHGHQRRLIAWFGIRGIGSLFYLFVALEHGVETVLANTLIGATLVSIAVSIALHGVSATPLMALYQKKPQPAAGEADTAADASS